MADRRDPETEQTTARAVAAAAPDGVGPDVGTLRDYGRLKHQVVDAVRSLQRILEQRGRSQDASACHDLMVRLAEDRFTLAVVGQFKRGKSSLMNAIIGRNLLPTGVLPLTSAITILKYGPAERLVIQNEGRGLPLEESASRLADYVTEKGNPGNRKHVKTACLEVPVPFLRRGLEFVDTPGVGSAIEANTATTYAFLPQCDGVLFVTSVDAPVTQAEVEFLGNIRQHVRRIFHVVNKIDLLAQAEQDEVLGYISEALARQQGAEQARLYAVSSRLGLQAKETNDPVGYAASGLKALEEELARFLVQDKAPTFLVAIIDRALRLLSVQPDDTDVSPAPAEPSVGDLTHRLEVIRQLLLDDQARPADQSLHDTAVVDSAESATVAEPTAHQPDAAVPATLDVAKDLQTRGCPLCCYLGETAMDFFAHWQYALSSNEAAQRQFAAEGGFCPVHTWQLAAVSSPQGMSLGYPKLVERLVDRLAHLVDSPGVESSSAIRALVPGPRECRVCHLLQQAQRAYVPRLISFLAADSGRRVYAERQGLCLHHLAVLTSAAPPELAEFLVTHAMRRFAEMAEDMRSYALKRDAIRRELSNRNEEIAHVLAITHIAGESRVCMPWHQDGEM